MSKTTDVRCSCGIRWEQHAPRGRRQVRRNIIARLAVFASLEAAVVFAQAPVPVNRLSASGAAVAGALPADSTDLTRLFAATSNLLRWDLVKGLPFIATGRIALDRTLADGKTVSNSYDVSCWRDSKGRRRVEYATKSPDSKRTSHVVTVWDPVNRTILNWTSGNETDYIVTLGHMPPKAKFQDSVGDPPHNHLPRANYENTHTENLSPGILAGLQVEGVRTTWTIPDKRTITVSSEVWISHEMKIIVRQITNDPRSGRSITELISVDRSNPHPALFQPPPDYHIKDFAEWHLTY